MNEIRVRPALPSERPELEALQERASLNNPGDRADLLANPDSIQLPPEQIAAGQVFIAEVAGSIVGFAAVLPREDGDAELHALFIEPSLWRRGYGAALVAHCVRVARDQGAKILHVLGNPHAEGFYTSCGFGVLGTAKTRFGSGLLMRKVL